MRRVRGCIAVSTLGLLWPMLAQAEGPGPLAECARIDAQAERLACYDRLSGRLADRDPTGAEAPAASHVIPSTPGDAASAPTTTTTTTTPTAAAKAPDRYLIDFWELNEGDKAGLLRLAQYRANYLLPLHYTNSINRSPQSPTQAAVALPDYRNLEAKLQISLRTKLAQDLFVKGANVWAAYTQQSFWQVYNSADSKPFRNSDYQPELMYMLPIKEGLVPLPGDWQWRYAQFGVVHQSNGQSDPLSRSWNRVYLGAGFEREKMDLTLRVAKRLHEDLADDDNPDISDYVGRGDIRFTWRPGVSTASLLYRSTLKSLQRGSLQFEWTYPLLRRQTDGLRWYVQVFSGYGETLTDYNFRQTSMGVA